MCRGTTNMEDVYLIKLDSIPDEQKMKLASPRWIERHGGIPVDKCIGKEIEFLICNGVVTVGSCCGHGKSKPTALVLDCSREILNNLGYQLREYSRIHTEQGIYEIELKNFTEVN